MSDRSTAFLFGMIVGAVLVGLLFAWPEASRRATESSQAAVVEQRLLQQEKDATTVVSNFCAARTNIAFTPRATGQPTDLSIWADAELTLCGWYWASPRQFPPWIR